VFDGVATDLQSIRLPWDAWHGDISQQFDLPASWRIIELGMADAPALEADDVEDALRRPLDAPPLERLAAGCRSAAIAVDDLTRPTNTAPLVEWIVAQLGQAGLAPGHVTVVIASGAHRRAGAGDIELKVGALANRVRVVAHDTAGDLADTGVRLGGVPIRLNRAFFDADLRIGIGCVMPHPFAGFSGGGKIVVPGLADLDVLTRTHKFALMGFQGGRNLSGNAFRGQMEGAVREIGLHWTVNVVVNSRRETAFVAAGDLVAAHRAAVTAAERIGATTLPDAPLDAVMVNAYPKDGELLQVEAALLALRSGLMNQLAPDAPIILTAACREGLGVHGLFGSAGRLFRIPAIKTFLNKRPLWLFSPGVDLSAARVVMHESYPFYSDWASLVDALQRRLRAGAQIGVVPCGPLQIVNGLA
jgi:nickel-dependent lactate racemase